MINKQLNLKKQYYSYNENSKIVLKRSQYSNRNGNYPITIFLENFDNSIQLFKKANAYQTKQSLDWQWNLAFQLSKILQVELIDKSSDTEFYYNRVKSLYYITNLPRNEKFNLEGFRDGENKLISVKFLDNYYIVTQGPKKSYFVIIIIMLMLIGLILMSWPLIMVINLFWKTISESFIFSLLLLTIIALLIFVLILIIALVIKFTNFLKMEQFLEITKNTFQIKQKGFLYVTKKSFYSDKLIKIDTVTQNSVCYLEILSETQRQRIFSFKAKSDGQIVKELLDQLILTINE